MASLSRFKRPFITNLDAMFEAIELPAAVSRLDTGLPHVYGDTFCVQIARESGREL